MALDVMKQAQELHGIFGWSAPPTPDMLRLFLVVTRTTVGWTIEEAAAEAGAAVDVVARLESTGEPLTDADDVVLADLAHSYEMGLPSTVNHPRNASAVMVLGSWIAGLRGDWRLSLGRFLRQRRQELGLTVDEVAARLTEVTRDEYVRAEWAGVVDDYDDDAREIAKALELPFLAVRLELEGIEPDDVEDFMRWRAEHDATAYRRGK